MPRHGAPGAAQSFSKRSLTPRYRKVVALLKTDAVDVAAELAQEGVRRRAKYLYEASIHYKRKDDLQIRCCSSTLTSPTSAVCSMQSISECLASTCLRSVNHQFAASLLRNALDIPPGDIPLRRRNPVAAKVRVTPMVDGTTHNGVIYERAKVSCGRSYSARCHRDRRWIHHAESFPATSALSTAMAISSSFLQGDIIGGDRHRTQQSAIAKIAVDGDTRHH